jgi:uncharacterized BrkB/YihY/UPF0761 family membrane protein
MFVSKKMESIRGAFGFLCLIELTLLFIILFFVLVSQLIEMNYLRLEDSDLFLFALIYTSLFIIFSVLLPFLIFFFGKRQLKTYRMRKG